MPDPLSHLTVIELAGVGPGPFACMLLAKVGARVIRIDRPLAPSQGGLDDLMRNYVVVDRGRQSLALNINDPCEVEAVPRLVEQADILVEGFRPSLAEKRGVGPAACHARNPRLVYGRMTIWGQTGPLAQKAGHDIKYVALSGALHASSNAEKSLPPLNLVGNYGGGMLLAMGVPAAVTHAQHSVEGSVKGQVVDAAMTNGAALLMSAQYGLMAKGFWGYGRGSNFLCGAAHFYGTYAWADGKHVSVGPIEPQLYRQLLTLCGITEPHFQQRWDESQRPALRAKLAAVLATRSRAEWCALLVGTDACFAPMVSMQEAADHPHNAARGTLLRSDGVDQPAPAPRFDRTPSALPPRAPRAGESTEALLATAGYSAQKIAGLVAAGVAHRSQPA